MWLLLMFDAVAAAVLVGGGSAAATTATETAIATDTALPPSMETYCQYL